MTIIIQESKGIDPRGESIEFDEYERNAYVSRFLDVFNADFNEEAMCEAAYEIHLEIRSRHDLYIAVADSIGSTYKRALHLYAECLGVWSNRKPIPRYPG